VIDGDRVRLTPAGAPEVQLACVPAGSIAILEDTWDVSGLAGTGSHDFGMAPQQYEEAGRMLLGLDRLQPLLRL
jgi:hypothetical protein